MLRDALVTYGRSDDSSHPLDVVDVGGGTGGFAVPLAELGHRVTVVDPSPDALASLERRAGETGVAVRAVQGDAAGLLDVVAPEQRRPRPVPRRARARRRRRARRSRPLAAALRPGGTLSVLAANRNAVVLARAIAGHFAEARHALDDPAGRWGPGDPLPRRFTETSCSRCSAPPGWRSAAVHGVRASPTWCPAPVDAEPGAAEALLELELATAERPEFRAVATQLHVLGRGPGRDR